MLHLDIVGLSAVAMIVSRTLDTQSSRKDILYCKSIHYVLNACDQNVVVVVTGCTCVMTREVYIITCN